MTFVPCKWEVGRPYTPTHRPTTSPLKIASSPDAAKRSLGKLFPEIRCCQEVAVESLQIVRMSLKRSSIYVYAHGFAHIKSSPTETYMLAEHFG